MIKDFVHLHNHSTYSFGDGISQIPGMVAKAKEMGMSALALTDHGYGHGLIEFYKECTKQGIKPLLGCELYITVRGVSLNDRTEANKSANHLILIAKNLTGYKNLVKILSIAATTGFYYKPKVDIETLTKYNEGLICLTACLAGPVSVNLYNRPNGKAIHDYKTAKTTLELLKSIYNDDLYFEIQFHNMAPLEGEQFDVQTQLIKNGIPLAKELGVNIVCTNDAHYVEQKHSKLRDIIMADHYGTNIYDQTREIRDKEAQYYLKSIDQMWNIFKDIDQSAVFNTLEIANKVETYDPGLKTGNKLPKFSEDSQKIFKDLVLAGFKQFYPDSNKGSKEYQRLIHEVKTIETLGFRDYFLIVQDFINYAENNSISIGPGRGSAAGSIVAYCLGITTLCPIKNDLLFERFLNPERIALPDIDIDVCKDRRNEVIKYVEDKYGSDHVCQIITFNKIKGKGSIKTVGRAMAIDYDVQNTLADALPRDAGEFTISLKQVVDESEEAPALAISTIKSFMEKDNKNKEYIENAVGLEGTYTHSGVHAAAVVISPNVLEEILPIQNSKDSLVTQYSMGDVEALGLLKMDFLGLDTLSVITNCLTMIMQDNPDGPLKNKKDIFTLRKLQQAIPDLNDNKVFNNTFSIGKTIGVFQCDSEGLRNLLAKMNCSSFNDVSAAIALYRPGPMESGMLDSFIKRRRGEEPETSWHPDMDQYTKSTHGLAIYQEQIMFASQVLCGFSMSKADELRKIIGKKKKEAILEFRKQFVDNAEKVGKVTKERAEEIYTEIEFFGRYAFNLAHSAAYAVISYYTAWLKTYYPAYFLCALLNKFVGGLSEEDTKKKKNDDELFYKYMLEAQTCGLIIEPPTISKSFMNFTVKDTKTLTYGLGSLKGIGSNVQTLIDYRDNVKKINTISGFCLACIELGINKRVAVEFARAGVLDGDREHLIKEFEGYPRPKKVGEGLTKTSKSILDDVRDIIKRRDKTIKVLGPDPIEAQKLINVANNIMLTDLAELDSKIPTNKEDITLIDPPGIYRIKKKVVK